MQNVSDSPPRAPPIKYTAPLGTRWSKEKAAAGGAAAFDLPTDPKNIGPWILGECVGKGASGRVKIAKHRRTGQLAAVKILPIAPLVNSRASLATQQAKSDKQRLGIDREITMMKLMNHPNIMRIYDVYEGDKELFLVLEYVEGGELFDFLVNRGRLPPKEALIYFRQILYGLNYAHTFSIIHRDLKPENILIASLSPPQIKIADWGMAAFAPPTLQLETSCGSPHYASPEIVNGEKYQGNATDIWSCGVILYALLTGRLPFDDKNVRTLLSKVKSGKYEMPSWIDPLARDLLSKMLIVDVTQRITIPEILSHPWLVSHAAIPFSSMEGATFTLLAPPLPPSPSILARPIASPEMIDSELFSSLRIIWGRHTDAQGESIKRDLCAPAGQGVHAKAFYFLLGKYREESYRNRSDDVEYDSQRTLACSTIDLGTLKFNLGWELDQSNSSGLRKYEVPKTHRIFSTPQGSSASTTSSTTTPPPYPSLSTAPPGATSRKRTFTDGSISAKDRPESPVGPRNPLKSQADAWSGHLQAQQGGSSEPAVAHNSRPKSSLGTGRSGPRPPPARRGHTYSSTSEGQTNDAAGATAIGFSQHLQQLQARAASSSYQRPKSSIGPPSPFSDAEKRAMFNLSSFTATAVEPSRQPLSPITSPNSSIMLGSGENNLPLLTAPKVENAQLQRTMDDITQKVNDLVQAVTQAPPGVGENREAAKAPVYSRTEEDKENQSIDEESWSHVSAETDRSGGLGLGVGIAVSRDVGRDVANAGPTPVSPAKARKEKEKKARPPPLELPSLNPRRPSLAMLGSPIALSSPMHQPPTSANRILASPVVGEFKGWFSNLFNWKQSNGHGGVLYSNDDIHRTRSDVAQILDNLGITLSTSAGETYRSELAEILFCRLDQPRVDPATGISLKNVRFRVEFRAGPGPSEPQTMLSPTVEENAYLIAAPSPNSSQLVTPNVGNTSRSRASILLGRTSAHGTPLPSPMGPAKWELPPGCLCVILLVHEKGSMSTFRAVWRKLREEYGDVGTGYPCFSPPIPTTPYPENHRMVM
ncbi:hypothetical protein GALMADRAFT_277414 [Galerina marginata CBS 339.88]|uniref:Protein kinase domain-containing protein n=1 Tax=Galerina marginata (strain CBS 339.88) TaxID=685588 RepID=A0A067TJQ4_GALM3|nr:hypothetical protein GALMADRAFT_277414 [Galerina marginata CBS 339.88]